MRTINYTVSYEKMISRLPALFAFLEIDEQGTCTIVKGTSGNNGDYGKIVANMRVPSGCGFSHTCTDDTVLTIVENREYSYRTIIDTYYKAMSDTEWYRDQGIYDEPFLAFVEKGIGKKYVGLTQEYNKDVLKCGVAQIDKFPLAPDYIYLGEAQSLLDKMIKMKKQLEFYEKHTKTCTDDRQRYNKLKTEYELSNGDKLITKLYELIEEAEEVADEYLSYAEGTNLTLNFNVNLVSTIKDLGMVTPYIQEWVEGRRYYEGDVVYYVDDNGYGMTWECVVNGKSCQDAHIDNEGRTYTEGHYDAKTELITFDNAEYTCYEVNTAFTEYKVIKEFKTYAVGTFILKDVYETLTDTEKANVEELHYGVADVLSQDEYDSLGYKTDRDRCSAYIQRNWKPQTFNWVKRNEQYICTQCGRAYDSNEQACKCGNNEFKYCQHTTEMPNTLTINGACNSHLASMRRFESYMTRDEVAEYPDPYCDWLWYYRINRIMNREAKYDEMGNLGVMYNEDYDDNTLYGKGVESIVNDGGIMGTNLDYYIEVLETFTGDKKTYEVGDTLTKEEYDGLDETQQSKCKCCVSNLAVWGDAITNIEAVNDEDNGTGTITFEYILGAHLMAKTGRTVQINADFTINGSSYKKGDQIPYDVYSEWDDASYVNVTPATINDITYNVGDVWGEEEYNEVKTAFNGCFDVGIQKVKINADFVYGGEIYTKDDVLTKEQYNALQEKFNNGVRSLKEIKDNLQLKVVKQFPYGATIHKPNMTLTKTQYNELDKVVYCVTEKIEQGDKTYEVDKILTQDEYNSLISSNKAKCKQLSAYCEVIKEFTEYNKAYADGDIITLRQYNKLIDADKAKCKQLPVYYKINEEFTEDEITYAVNYFITKDEYDQLTDEDKAKCEEAPTYYKLSNSTSAYSITYDVGDIITQQQYRRLKSENQAMCKQRSIYCEVFEEFTEGSKTYEVGDILTQDEYNKITTDNQAKCQWNKDKVEFVIQKLGETILRINKHYHKGQIVPQEEYDEFSLENQSKCQIKVIKDFRIKYYDSNARLDRSIEYQKDDVISFRIYLYYLSETDKRRVQIEALEDIVIKENYQEGWVIDREKYEELYNIYQDNIGDYVKIVTLARITNGGNICKKGEAISRAFFDVQTVAPKYVNIFATQSIVINDSGKVVREFEEGDYIDTTTYNSLPPSAQKCCKVLGDWYSKDDDGNYKYYFTDFEIDTVSNYGKNMGVKYTETYIYYKGDVSMVVTENIGEYQVTKVFTYKGKTYAVGQTLEQDEYFALDSEHKKYVQKPKYFEGTIITEAEYNRLTDDEKASCKHSEETIWTLVSDGIFSKYVNGEFDKDYAPIGVTEDESYYKLYDKMEFHYEMQTYQFRIGSRIKRVPYIQTAFTTNVDITHVDVEERPLIRYDYYNGVNFQPSTNIDDVYIERGVTQAFEKHIKLGEIKTFEDFENYANGGFFTISKEDIDLG